MRLQLFTVTNFRSIKKAEKLPLGEFSVLIGPNNEGKSNILQAMVLGMSELSAARPTRQLSGRVRRPRRSQGGYDWERDFPQSLQESDPDGKTTMRFDLLLTDEEVAEFHQEVGNRLNDALPISLTFSRDRPPVFRVRKPRHAAALSAKRKEIAQFVSERVEVEYIEAVRTGRSVQDLVATMLERELRAAASENTDIQQALEALREAQRPVFDSISSAITQRLRQLLPDVQSVQIEPEETGASPVGIGRGISIVVDDGTPTDLMYKGDGVQSLAALALTQHYSTARARAREFILAVEEPEAHLHPHAIHGLRDALRETAAAQQVVITTHSPLFVNRLDLQSNIIVEKNRARPATSVQELRDVLGVQAADNLANSEVVLVVEGQNDASALRSLLSASTEELAAALQNGVLGIIPLHGGGKLHYLLTQIRDSLAAIHAFLDHDVQGKQAAEAARKQGLLSPSDVTFTIVPGSGESEFEDLIEPGIYSDTFLREFNVNLDHGWTTRMSKGKWSSRMAHVFGASGAAWSPSVEAAAKRLLASDVAAAPQAAIKPGSRGVLDALTTGLTSKLTSRSR